MKQMLVLFLCSSILLFGCSSESEEKNYQVSSDIKDEEENIVEEEVNDIPTELNKAPEEIEKEVEEEIIKEPQYSLHPKLYNLQPINDAKNNVVLLTIDDAPDKYAVEMAQTLKELNVKAIFFVNGHFIDSEEEKMKLKQIHEMGFEIGNHTWNHKELPTLSVEEQKQEIVALNDEIESVIGERPRFFRAPHGLNTDESRELAEQEKMLVMNWSYGYDFMEGYMTEETIADIMVNTELLQNGANLLMHDREWTNAALKDIVTGIQNKGFDIVDPALIKTP